MNNEDLLDLLNWLRDRGYELRRKRIYFIGPDRPLELDIGQNDRWSHAVEEAMRLPAIKDLRGERIAT
jgi:hypothetical protein